jgi:hypothetical protein
MIKIRIEEVDLNRDKDQSVWQNIRSKTQSPDKEAEPPRPKVDRGGTYVMAKRMSSRLFTLSVKRKEKRHRRDGEGR